MPVSHHHIPREADIVSHEHLKNIKFPSIDAKIGLLIGNNVPDAYSPLEVRTGSRGSPHAVRSLLGWIVWNLVRPSLNTHDLCCTTAVEDLEIWKRREVQVQMAVTSPSCSNAALRRTSIENSDAFEPEIVEMVKNDFYVDDFLKSVKSPEKAVAVIKDDTRLCQKGDFRLTKWISNDHSVMKAIPAEERAKDEQAINLDRDQVTIPRMELTAATLAVKLANMITHELSYNIHTTHYWTDSMSAIRYIANNHTRFQTFVANRVSFIRDSTHITQWRYIETKMNPADVASRGLHINKLMQKDDWLKGPSLEEDESDWPAAVPEPKMTIDNDDPEVKQFVNTTVDEQSNDAMDRLISHYSSWSRLKKAVGWLKLIVRKLRGLERQIQSVRKVLYSLLHQQVVQLTDESLQTLFCEVEAILNNRPITAVSSSAHDLCALTPNHLLTLRIGEDVPPGIFHKDDNFARRRWRQVQYLADVFWKRWLTQYLPMLQVSQKWTHGSANVNVGDVVLIVDNRPRNSWALARVLEVYPDVKGHVRTVRVKTSTGELVRPISKLCRILESDILP